MRQELDERPIESHRRFCPAQLRTKHHAVLLSGACLIAAAGTGCSVLFGGSRYVGGTDLDAAEPDLDASSDAASDEDVSGPIDPDAHVEDAYAGPDAVTPCVDTASCGADEVCDPERSVCLPCDGDGDGIRARGCAMDDRRFFDCDPDHASRVTSMVLTDGFQDTLRVFHEGGETHVFFRDPRSVNTFQVGVDGVQRELDYGGVRVDEIDAVRTPDGVVIAGVHREGFVQYVLEPSGPEERGALLYADTAEFGTILVASSVPAILSASVTPTSVDALVEVQSMMRDGTPIGRHVIGIGSGHQARVWGSSGLPDDRVAASANGIAVVPGSGLEGARRSFFVVDDVRPLTAGNVGRAELPFRTTLSQPFGQIAMSAGSPIEAIGRIGVIAHAGPARGTFTAYLVTCVTSPPTICERPGEQIYALPDMDPGIALAQAPGSSSMSVVFTATEAEFRIHLLETYPEGATGPYLPSSLVSMFSMPVPGLTDSPTELAMDLTADLSVDPPVITLTLARASGSRIQTVTTEICVDVSAP